MNDRSIVPVYSVYQTQGHPALALGMIASYAKTYKNGALCGAYEFVPDILDSVAAARTAIEKHGPGIMLCSSYIWSHASNVEIARTIKEQYPESFTIFGGPSVPKYEETCRTFFENASYVDVAVRGEGEVVTAEVLERLAAHRADVQRDRRFLGDVAGLSARQHPSCGVDKVFRTADRERVLNIDTLPSPYLAGWFSGEQASRWVAATLETNRGCPYGCTFCDWGAATLSKVRQFAMERVQGELQWIARHRVGVLWIADANFGIFKRDVEIAEMIAACRREWGYPTQVIVNYAKQGTERIADIVGVLKAADVTADGIISIQTQDPQTLSNIRRSNIKTEHYNKLIRVFRKRELQVSSDLMIGLPGATVESFKADLQFFFDREVYAKAYQTVVLPNSPMGDPEYMKKYAIKVDRKGNIISTYSFTPFDLFTMNQIYLYYKVAIGYGLLKYVLHFLQYDHGVKAMTVIDDLQRQVNDKPRSLPRTAALVQALVADGNFRRVLLGRTADDWSEWYDEVAQFIEERYDVTGEPLDAVMAIQAKLLPERGRDLPERVDTPYDIAAYLADSRRVASIDDTPASGRPRLETYGPGTLDISDPHGLCALDCDRVREDHQIEWELASALVPSAATYGADRSFTSGALGCSPS